MHILRTNNTLTSGRAAFLTPPLPSEEIFKFYLFPVDLSVFQWIKSMDLTSTPLLLKKNDSYFYSCHPYEVYNLQD